MGGGIVELAALPGSRALVACTQDCRVVVYEPAGPGKAPDEGPAAAGALSSRQLIGNSDEVTDLRFFSMDQVCVCARVRACGG